MHSKAGVPFFLFLFFAFRFLAGCFFCTLSHGLLEFFVACLLGGFFLCGCEKTMKSVGCKMFVDVACGVY